MPEISSVHYCHHHHNHYHHVPGLHVVCDAPRLKLTSVNLSFTENFSADRLVVIQTAQRTTTVARLYTSHVQKVMLKP
jgi:metal-dependent hydrolase (beta-lactamase superfamily II)